VFDFLVDDHDRQAEKNWIEYEVDSRLILWDNGLAWSHGPYGRESCLDILCGSNSWRALRSRLTVSKQCQRICTFRKSTIDKLRNFTTADETNRLGYRLRQAMADSEYAPFFDSSVYYSNANREELVHFAADQFFTGMDIKVERLLKHVDTCIETHGEERVILDVEA
jgi:hypothetical protein